MADQHEIELAGCTPEPLMNYLKALGVLRLVAEQIDPKVRGAWKNGVFVLRSTLNRGGLIEFFEQAYQPTPAFSPWNGDGGFLTDSGTSYATVERIKHHAKTQLGEMQAVIGAVQQISSLKEFAAVRDRQKELTKKKDRKRATSDELAELKAVAARVKEIKESILFRLRNEFPDQSLVWLDACLLIDVDGFAASPVLGSGGCDGRMEFSANFLSNILLVLEDDRSRSWLLGSLLAEGKASLVDTSIGQFAPGRIGGPNATHGMEGFSMLNPWDYVLMMEGVVLLAGSVTRKLNTERQARAAFPFTVLASSVGNGSLEQSESQEARGELWLPLWDRYAGLAEIASVFSEGRSQLTRRQSLTAVDFARAVAGLGIDRGIRSFSRQGFLKRNGLAFLATPLGEFDVQLRSSADLLHDIDRWLEGFRRACNEDAPSRLRAAARRIEGAIFDFCRYGEKRQFAEIVCAIGNAERELAGAERLRAAKFLVPLSGLSTEWLDAASDGSVEFELAAALAGIHDPGRKIGPVRANLEPVDWKRWSRQWADKERSVVWNSADLSTNLIAVLSRRLMDGTKQGSEGLPIWSRRTAPLSAVSSFIAGNVDDHRIEELLWGLMLVESSGRETPRPAYSGSDVLPRAYALLKLLFLPTAVSVGGVSLEIRPDPEVVPLLGASRVEEACRLAMRRLRVTGLRPLPHRRSRESDGDLAWMEATSAVDSRRLAASLLIPISQKAIRQLMQLVTRRDEETQNAISQE
ncbi:MAG: type I-G CRISPR-associated protein Cas8g1/Csx17 [Pirellulales bacterium]